MGTGFGEAVEGWVKLGEWWLDSWSKHASKIATKVDSRHVHLFRTPPPTSSTAPTWAVRPSC